MRWSVLHGQLRLSNLTCFDGCSSCLKQVDSKHDVSQRGSATASPAGGASVSSVSSKRRKMSLSRSGDGDGDGADEKRAKLAAPPAAPKTNTASIASFFKKTTNTSVVATSTSDVESQSPSSRLSSDVNSATKANVVNKAVNKSKITMFFAPKTSTEPASDSEKDNTTEEVEDKENLNMNNNCSNSQQVMKGWGIYWSSKNGFAQDRRY